MKRSQTEASTPTLRTDLQPRILLVDDTEGNLVALEALLEGVDVTPVRARSGQEALTHLLRGDFALLILDVRMPEIGGFEVARLVRRHGRHKDLPIIFATAADITSEEVESAYALGAVDFLFKPIGPEAFRSKVRTFVELYRSKRDLERRVAERTAELEGTSARLRLFVDQCPAIQWMTDVDLRFTLSVGTGLAAVGLKPGQMVGVSMVDLMGPQDASIEAHRRALRGESLSYEALYSGRRFENTLEPLRDSKGKVIGVVGVGFDRTDQRVAEQTLRLVGEVGQKLASELDLEKLVQATTDVATKLIEAQFGAFFYNVTNEKGESYLLYTISGVPREAFEKFPMPRNTADFAPTFNGEGIVRSDDIRKDPRYGKNAPHQGMPQGHLPVVSYLAVPVTSRSGGVLGGLFFGHAEAGRFTENHERLVSGIAAYAAVAIENARLYRRAQEALVERERAEVALRESRGELQEDLTDVTLLQQVGGEMIREGDAQALFEGIMDAATRIMKSQFASIQMICDRGNGAELRLLAFRGFSPEAAAFWEYVRAGSGSTCGAALRTGRRVIASDVERSEVVAGTEDMDTYLQTGIRAVQTTPLLSRSGALVGMISTHWKEPHEPSERDLRLFDILARQAADLIERRRAEEQLRSLNAELEERVRERTQSLRDTIGELDSFAYTVAHDLRSPLRAVHSFGEMLLETAAPKLDETEKGYFAAMVRAGGRMDALITDLLAYTRLTRQDVSLRELDLETELDRILDEMREELAAKRADVSVLRPLPKVMAHPLLLGQAVANLVSNAAKFVVPGRQPQIRIGAENGKGRVRLWVEDNGIGISPQYQGKLFKIFERLQAGAQFPGTGIGLAIVRRAAERMSGTAGVQSEEGKGSRFWLELGSGARRS